MSKKERTYIVPEVLEFRGHICSILNFMQLFIGYNEYIGNPYPEIADYIDLKASEELQSRIENAKGAYLELNDADMLLQYACADLMTKLLVTSAGEALAAMILKNVKGESDLKKFENYRKYYIATNSHVISNIEKNLKNSPTLKALKLRLSQVNLNRLDR